MEPTVARMTEPSIALLLQNFYVIVLCGLKSNNYICVPPVEQRVHRCSLDIFTVFVFLMCIFLYFINIFLLSEISLKTWVNCKKNNYVFTYILN